MLTVNSDDPLVMWLHCWLVRVPRFTGVDGSIEWLAEVRKLSPPHYRFHWADIGNVGSWSMPTSTDTAPKWPFYSTAALAAESEASRVSHCSHL